MLALKPAPGGLFLESRTTIEYLLMSCTRYTMLNVPGRDIISHAGLQLREKHAVDMESLQLSDRPELRQCVSFHPLLENLHRLSMHPYVDR